MKPLFFGLLLLLSFSSARAQVWPRNPKTGKVEFTGVLPWPRANRTDSARQMLAWDWYTQKLSTQGKQHVERQNSAAISPALLTYAGLPKTVGFKEGDYYMNCVADLIPGNESLRVYLHDFTISSLKAKLVARPIEGRLLASKNEQAALAALRKRLAVALANW